MTSNEPRTLPTLYLPGEGRASLDVCLDATFSYSLNHAIRTIVIYTGSGDGPALALERYLSQPQYSAQRVVAVTPPAQKSYLKDPRNPEVGSVKAGIVGARRELFRAAGIPIVSARLPFRSIHGTGTTVLESMQLVDRALGVLGGGFSLCVQAALLSCDAGVVEHGERVAVMTADTSLVVLASHSESFYSETAGLLVEHIICRPSLYDISRAHHYATVRAASAAESTALELDEPSDEPDEVDDDEGAPGAIGEEDSID